MMLDHLIPESVVHALRLLELSGHEAYLVGGAVRDLVLNGFCSGDWDITTSASLDEIEGIFRDASDDFRSYKYTTTVKLDGLWIDIAPYRKEFYRDCEICDVEFGVGVVDDLLRRDFTVNTLLYGLGGKLVDTFGGLNDLSEGIVRVVGDAAERFIEDPSRILRCFSMLGKLATTDAFRFKLDLELEYTIEEYSFLLERLSMQKKWHWMKGVLLSNSADDILRYMNKLELLDYIIPDFSAYDTSQYNSHHTYSVLEHTFVSLGAVRSDARLRMAVLFHDLGKIFVKDHNADGTARFWDHAKYSELIAKDVLRHVEWLKPADKEMVSLLIREHDSFMNPATKAGLRRIVSRLGLEAVGLLLEVYKADIAGQSLTLLKDKMSKFDSWEALYSEYIAGMRKLAVNGNDLIEIGYEQGREREIGDVLGELKVLVDEGTLENKKERLLNYARLRKRNS